MIDQTQKAMIAFLRRTDQVQGTHTFGAVATEIERLHGTIETLEAAYRGLQNYITRDATEKATAETAEAWPVSGDSGWTDGPHKLDPLVARTQELIDRMVDRFLTWPLPETVCSDLCVTQADGPHAHLRRGTNLLTADEARQMIEYLLLEPQ